MKTQQNKNKKKKEKKAKQPFYTIVYCSGDKFRNFHDFQDFQEKAASYSHRASFAFQVSINREQRKNNL